MIKESMVALITPFDGRGQIDIKTLQELVRWHIDEGTDAIVCSGTTGEAPALSEADRKRVLQACLESAEGKIPVIAGTGTSDTRQTVRLTETAQKLGASGCLVVAPYYNKPSQRGCFLHFQEVSKVGLPFIIYNNPGRTVIQLQPETIRDIAQLPHAAALKESTNDPLFLRKVRKETAIPIVVGEDAITYEMLEEGAVGAVSVIGNLIPRVWKEAIHLALSDRWAAAKEIVMRYLPLMHAMGKETNPIGIKTAVSAIGKCKLNLRLPLVVPSKEFQQEITRVLREVHLGLPQRQ